WDGSIPDSAQSELISRARSKRLRQGMAIFDDRLPLGTQLYLRSLLPAMQLYPGNLVKLPLPKRQAMLHSPDGLTTPTLLSLAELEASSTRCFLRVSFRRPSARLKARNHAEDS